MIALLRNPVRHSAWGSTTVIPELLGIEPDGRPHAELWIGTHPSAPSRLVLPDGEKPLPHALPFLLKVLAAAGPLSLQVHPSRELAAAGHADEERRGVRADDRCFPDTNHKPEMICALSPFRLAVGIRPPIHTAGLLDALGVPELRDAAATLRATPTGGGVRVVLESWLRLPRPAAEQLATQVAAAVAQTAPPAGAELVWAGVARLAVAFPGDIGVVVSLAMHHRELAPGDALFVPAGTLHAYLEGSAIEIMAASDNVARAGLTPKHVDVDTVLRLADTRPGEPQLVGARRVSAVEEAYDTPVPDFQLSRLRVPPGRPVAIDCAAPQVLLVVAGSGTIGQGAETIHVDKGSAVYADGTPIFLEGIRGEVVLFRATTTCRNDRDDAVGESS